MLGKYLRKCNKIENLNNRTAQITMNYITIGVMWVVFAENAHVPFLLKAKPPLQTGSYREGSEK